MFLTLDLVCLKKEKGILPGEFDFLFPPRAENLKFLFRNKWFFNSTISACTIYLVCGGEILLIMVCEGQLTLLSSAK